jgi:hypothetical protein
MTANVEHRNTRSNLHHKQSMYDTRLKIKRVLISIIHESGVKQRHTVTYTVILVSYMYDRVWAALVLPVR